jgi:predicted lipoprotein with Yx(FWY)xxD motif
MNHRTHTHLVITAAATMLVLAACGSSSSTRSTIAAAPTTGAPPTTTAAVASVDAAALPTLGTVLVDAQGVTLYHNTKESGTTIVCTGSCTSAWPPLLAAPGAAPTGGTGVTGALATVTRPDGGSQVTYNGMALYHFAADQKPGDAKGQGLGNVWFVVPATAAATPAGAPSASAPATTGPPAAGAANTPATTTPAATAAHTTTPPPTTATVTTSHATTPTTTPSKPTAPTTVPRPPTTTCPYPPCY